METQIGSQETVPGYVVREEDILRWGELSPEETDGTGAAWGFMG